jgi:uncharacterized protein YecE (DUF72 family)
MINQRAHIGTSGFAYKDWLGNFYARSCPQGDYLANDIYAYFNNHFSGHAPTTAFRLLELLAK